MSIAVVDKRVQALLDQILERIKSLTPKKTARQKQPDSGKAAGEAAAKAIEKFIHEEPDDRKTVFKILGNIYPKFANELAIAMHSITGEKTIFRNLLISLVIQAEEWEDKDKKAAYRMIAGLWVKHNDKTRREIEAMLIQRNCHEHMHNFLKFLHETNHPLYNYIKKLLPKS